MGLVQGTGKQREGVRSKRKPVRRSIPMASIQPAAAASVALDAPPWPMPQVEAPKFPNRVVDIRDHGAIGDDRFDCTTAIARAITACADAGAGRVLIPRGTWFTGPIHLRSNIDLHIEQGATVRFSSNPEHYLPPVFVRWSGQECFNFSPLIYARDCNNIAITGGGALLGQGKTWWAWEKREKRAMTKLYQMVVDGVPSDRRCFGTESNPLRPQFILPINCTNVLLEDFTVAEGGPFWTIHLAYCRNVTVRRLNINASEGPNNDGIVLDSCEDVIVEDCDLKTREDCVSLKSGLNEDGQRVGKPTKNVVVRRIRASAGAGAIAIGSDMSGGVRNVFVHDCAFDGPAIGVRLKAARGRGGVVEDVIMQNITMGQIAEDAIQLTTEYASFVSPNGKAPIFRNILFRGVTCAKAKTAVRMIGLPESALRNITLERIDISAEQGLFCNSGNGIRVLNVNITPLSGPVLSLRDSQDVLIQGLNNARGATVFLDLRGRQTRQIRLHGETNDDVRPAVVLGLDVPKDALVHE